MVVADFSQCLSQLGVLGVRDGRGVCLGRCWWQGLYLHPKGNLLSVLCNFNFQRG